MELESQLVSGRLQVEDVDIHIDIFKIEELINLLIQVDLQVWNKSTIGRVTLIKEMLATLVRLSIKTSTFAELRIATELDSMYKFKHNILNPLYDMDYIIMTDPDKPRSSKQSYKLTNKGRKLFEK